ncbi:hypothetical protein AYY26_09640 [Photobacterium phosphoreum]|uniref:hypothetical protein n=1 Tax=Photobacterium phosphoreum TaxID=659 RepID=UPI0007F95770|nr:hypothetical protein [Photobacterium phosphoreum]MCD9518055.1 hypothetical protein [Photobacterium phosphoreum]OBU37326.1 hypothetical protein AYY26_09640 [Photobacterium phosphoreum]
MSKHFNYIVMKFINFIFILILMILPIIAVRYDVLTLHNNIPEQSLTEWTEEMFLAITAGSFLFIGFTDKKHHHGFILISAFFFCMLIRELDSFFDNAVFHGFWVYPAIITAITALYYSIQKRENTLNTLYLFVKDKNFPILCIGLAIIFVFSRLFGMEVFWHQVMGSDFQRIVKNIAEETTELLGYTIIIYAAANYVFSFNNKKINHLK